MPRSPVHDTDEILDAARELLLGAGATRASIDAIARRSGAPVGSLYHRFGSRDELIARLWVRAVKRSQEQFLAAIEHPDPREALVRAALSFHDFVKAHRDDARLLISFRREDLLWEAHSPELAAELRDLNRPVLAAFRRLAEGIFGNADKESIDQVVLAVYDIPHGAVRRHLIADKSLPRSLRGNLETAVRALLRSISPPAS